MDPEEEWTIECSDEEMYEMKSRITTNPKKEKVWQPNGPRIAVLYQQIEREGLIPFKWICPGRRSPSVHSDNGEEKKKQVEINDIKTKSAEINQFDFDEDQPQNSASFPKVASKRRPTTGQRKVTKLDKVMNDMKKYYVIQSGGNQ